MNKKLNLALYHRSFYKTTLERVITILLFVILLPLFILIIFMQRMFNSKGPVLFVQKRTGKNGVPFDIYKFRTMNVNADKQKVKYKKLNISDGPVFKIPNDPRFTAFGKLLAKLGIDELPQLLNVVKGEMSIVGPRPLPVTEAKKLTSTQKVREKVLPGITSSWVIKGGHQMTFPEWMKLDREYVENASFQTDVYIIVSTLLLGVKTFINQTQKL